jgi:hypothetical protein
LEHSLSDDPPTCLIKVRQLAELGRGLINAKPNPNGCELDEGEIVGRKSVISSCDAPTLLDLVEKSLDQITRSVQIRAKADFFFAIPPRRDVGPGALLTGKCPDPVRIISAIRQQHCVWAQFAQENRAKLIVVRLTGRETELHRQAIGVHDGMNLCRQATSGSAHVLLTIARNAASVLMHAHD